MTISYINFGEILRSLRLYKGMSAEDVAKDICSTEDLHQFEKDKKYPTIDQLYKIASKLNVEPLHFFDFAAAGSANYVTAVFDLIKKYKRDRNYKAISEIVEQEKGNPLFNLPSSKQFLLWHEAICLYYLGEPGEKEAKRTIKMLYQAIELTNPSMKGLTEREIEILIAIALIEKDSSNYREAISLLKEALNAMEELPMISDPRVQLRALFGLAQSLSNSENYSESLIYSNKGLSQCINDEIMYLFGEFYYQSAHNYILMGNIEKGKEYLQKSIQIFDLQRNDQFVNLVKSELKKISE